MEHYLPLVYDEHVDSLMCALYYLQHTPVLSDQDSQLLESVLGHRVCPIPGSFSPFFQSVTEHSSYYDHRVP